MSLFNRQATQVEASSLAWEEVDCPLCGSGHWAPLLEAADAEVPVADALRFMVVRCQDCGLGFTNPRPASESQSTFFPAEDLRTLTGAPLPKKSIWRGGHWGQTCEERLLPVRGQGRLLVVGFALSKPIRRWQGCGWHVTALDLAETALATSTFDLQWSPWAGLFAQARLEPHSFDAIALVRGLECVHAPGECLEDLKRFLNPGGRVLVRTPNLDSWAFRHFGPAWAGLNLPRNLSHFTPATLRSLLHQAGYRVLRLNAVRERHTIRRSALLARFETPQRTGLPVWMAKKFPAALATWYAYFTRQADGLLALATME